MDHKFDIVLTNMDQDETRSGTSFDKEFNHSQTLKDKIVNVFKNITVEPILLIFNTAMLMAAVAVQSLVMRKYCLINLGYPEEICLNLTNNKTLEDETQEFSSNFITYKTILDTLPAALWAIVIGPWSDKNGRLTLLIIPSVAAALGTVVVLICSIYESQISVNYILIGSALLSLSGGIVSFQTGTSSYLADVTGDGERTTRFAIAQSFSWLGCPIGNLATALLYKYFGLVTVFSVVVGMYVTCVLYVIIFLKETIKSTLNFREKCYSLLDFKVAKEGVATLRLKRKNHDRLHMFLLIATAGISFLPVFAEFNTLFLYTRWKFDWDFVMYNNFSLLYYLFIGIGLLIVLPIMSSLCKISDEVLALISTATKILMELIIAYAFKTWMLFAVTPISIFAGMISALTRTILSKIISPEEQATLLSIINAAEAITPTIGVLTFTALYNATRTTFPAAVFYLSAGIAVIPTILIFWIYVQRRHVIQEKGDLISADRSEIN